METVDLASLMQEYATVAVRVARKEFGVQLDFTEASLADVDLILGSRTRQGLFNGDSTPEETLDEVWRMSLVWGGYVGELIRLNLGGTWHARPGETDTIRPMLRVATLEGSPVEKVYKRLTESEANDVSNYYYGLKRLLEKRQAEARQGSS